MMARTIYCANSACDGPIGMADFDAPYCRICGDVFCEAQCRDEHIREQHPQAAEFAERFGFTVAA